MKTQASQSVDEVIERHFAEPSRTIRLEESQVLFEQGQRNTRLYRVRSGVMLGEMQEDDGTCSLVMRAGPGDLVGVQSFFGSERSSTLTVTAQEPTELGYIERDMPIKPGEPSLERLLMPIVLNELLRRQRSALELAERERETRERLDELERVSSLGQLAAGVAHELNNALTVLVRGTVWLSVAIQQRIDKNEIVLHRAFDAGMANGRCASAADVRVRTPLLEKEHGLSFAKARKLAQTGLTDAQLFSFGKLKKNVDPIVELWELGATIHDMQLSADQAAHVVKSMRDLGANRTLQAEPTDINETIQVALKILRGQLSQVEITKDLGELPSVVASRGKLVQVWTNIIKNGVEAMTVGRTRTHQPALHIASYTSPTHVVVTIDDNGPGIPADVLPRIFEPSFTTKKHGLSFGLGLGLSIVQRLVSEQGGTIDAVNTATGARFIIRLPREVLDE